MPDYAIVFARSARKELEALDPPMIERVIARIEALAHDPLALASCAVQEIYGASASATIESSTDWTIGGE
jgi:hypothetical protein